MIKFLRFSFVLLSVVSALSVQATHNRAGEITYVADTSDYLSITATITTYTKASSVPADRDSLEICWGYANNNTPVCEWVQRSNGNGTLLPNDTKKNLYIATHKFPGIGHYVISMTDPNRNGGILNVNPPSSDNVPFHLQTTVTIFNPQFSGFNNSPVLLQPPIDIACIGQPFIHNPNAYDVDGDSLSYKLTVPLQAVGTLVPNYSFPDQIPNPGSLNNILSINEITGDLTWDSPQLAGEYNVAIHIIEWRNGAPLDTMIRDMQITVLDCNNEPPVIETIDELCVIAGTLVDFEVIATDPDIGQKVRLTALGGPFEVNPSPAQFIPNDNSFEVPPVVRNFVWQTTCEHISDQFYSVVFKATDDFLGDTSGLATLKTIRIKVVGPPPEDLQAVAVDEQIDVSWEQPYACEIVEDDYFKGFSVWRKLGSNAFPLDTCDPGLDGKGYTLIANKLFDISGGRYVYTDLDVERGRNYCYRIVADFAKTSAGGFSFNFVESLASEEICVQLSRDVPLITNVSVVETDLTNGEIFVQWSTPNAEDLDTVLNHGPYRYEVWRAEGITNAGFAVVPNATFDANNFYEAVDTFFTDSNGLNTKDNPYTYRVAFYVKGEFDEPLGFTNDASSTFLNIASTDQTNILTWDLEVPWDNSSYTIYRRDNANPTQYDSIGVSNTEEYIDMDGLSNGIEYCYFVKGYGSYNIEGILPELINDSQIACGIPLDTIPPCPPILDITNGCEDLSDLTPPEVFENLLTWDNPINICEETDDVVSYNVYYAPPTDMGNFELIAHIMDSSDTTLMHNSEFGIAGCYAVTAIDTFENESAFSNVVCVDNCPIYNLPNAFTPNGDGDNELFIPYPYRFVDRVEFNVFNIWGELVYSTTDPALGWDGKNLRGKDVAQGVYYYTCRVYEKRVSGITESPEILNGFIELLR